VPAVSRETLRGESGRSAADQGIQQIETATRYAGYIEKQAEDVARTARADAIEVPAAIDYSSVHALSFEARQVLSRHRPATIGAAARLPGITPATISLLLVHLKKSRRHALAEPRPADLTAGVGE
jgi:tRNA uridine 5-carboxymethylaminomethyl modification enzyme